MEKQGVCARRKPAGSPENPSPVETVPDPENGEGAVLHAQSQVDAVGADGCAADGLLHVAARDEGVVNEAPDPAEAEGGR